MRVFVTCLLCSGFDWMGAQADYVTAGQLIPNFLLLYVCLSICWLDVTLYLPPHHHHNSSPWWWHRCPRFTARTSLKTQDKVNTVNPVLSGCLWTQYALSRWALSNDTVSTKQSHSIRALLGVSRNLASPWSPPDSMSTESNSTSWALLLGEFNYFLYYLFTSVGYFLPSGYFNM